MTSQVGGERPLHLKSSPQAAAAALRSVIIHIIFNNTCSLNYWRTLFFSLPCLDPFPLRHSRCSRCEKKVTCYENSGRERHSTEQHITLQTFCWLDLLTFWTWNIARRAMIYRLHFAKCLRAAAREVNTLVACARSKQQRGNSFCEKNAREWVTAAGLH